MSTITAADIKLLASARMTDAADAGGPMSGTALQDGVDNNVFPDIAAVDRARGAVTLRKIFPAVLNNGADALLGAHLIIDTPSNDANTSVLLVAGSGQAQTQAQLVASLNSASPFKGTTVLTAIAAAAAVTLSVAGTTAALIPKATATSASSGALAASTVAGLVDSGKTTVPQFFVNSSQTYLQDPNIVGSILKPGSVSGTLTAGGVTYTVASDAASDTVTLTNGSTVYTMARSGSGWATPAAALYPSAQSVSAANVLVPVDLPVQSAVVPVTSASQVLYTIGIPAGTVPGAESFSFTTGAGTLLAGPLCTSAGATLSPPTWAAGNISTVTIDRTAGTVTLVFNTAPKINTNLTLGFAAGGATQPIASGPATLNASGQATVTLTSGYRPATISLVIGGMFCVARNGLVTTGGSTIGTLSDAGLLNVPSRPNAAITGWYGTQVLIDAPLSTLGATVPAGATGITVAGTTAAGSAFTSTASGAGVFSTSGVTGTYNSATGALSLAFAAPVKASGLTYSLATPVSNVSAADLHGLVEANFGSDGRVTVMRLNDVVVLHHTDAVTTSATGTVNCGRTNLSNVRLVGANGAPVTTGYTANLAAGTVSITSLAGVTLPVSVQHSIEHVAVIAGIPTPGSITINQPLTRAFPVGSVLSSAVVLNTLQAIVGDDFSQATWTDVWSDTRIGSAISPQYDQIARPIVVTNQGAITDRWALIFTTTTAFRVVSEALGQIATGDINSTLAPVNPATGVPYFTLVPQGWGLGWAAGNVLRFNTTGANAPVWPIRCIQPSAPTAVADSVLLAVRGSVNV